MRIVTVGCRAWPDAADTPGVATASAAARTRTGRGGAHCQRTVKWIVALAPDRRVVVVGEEHGERVLAGGQVLVDDHRRDRGRVRARDAERLRERCRSGPSTSGSRTCRRPSGSADGRGAALLRLPTSAGSRLKFFEVDLEADGRGGGGAGLRRDERGRTGLLEAPVAAGTRDRGGEREDERGLSSWLGSFGSASVSKNDLSCF